MVIKAIGVAGLVPSGIWAVYSYRKKREKEFRMPLWDKQLSLYFEATEVATKTATLPDGLEKTKAVDKFWELYYGPLVVVEDNKNVAQAMINFGNCLGGANAKEPRNCSGAELRNLALELGQKCRESIADSWDVKLKSLASGAAP